MPERPPFCRSLQRISEGKLGRFPWIFLIFTGYGQKKLLGYALNGTQQAGNGYGKYCYGVYSYGKHSHCGHYGESNRDEKVSER